MTAAEASSVAKLVKYLAEQGQGATSIEIAETLWLAMQIEPATPREETESVTERPRDESRSAVVEVDSDPAAESPPKPKPKPKPNLATPVSQVGVLPPKALPVWLADPPMLQDALAIIRALKPLLQKVAAGIGERLDEAATVDNIARTQLYWPILKPEQEPWLDIVLVVDQGRSMHIWQRLVKDIVRILQHYGAFRDVQVFDLWVNQPDQAGNQTTDNQKQEDRIWLISNPQRPGHRPSEVIDQQGRRVVIVLSDCAGSYWWDGTLLPVLHDWGEIMPTVVWQVLPPWMWKRTALGRGTAVALKNDQPGVANQRLQTLDAPEDAQRCMPLPVVTSSEVSDLSRWSLMVAGDLRQVVPGFLLPQQGGRVPRNQSFADIARAKGEQLAQQNKLEPQAAFEQALMDLAQERVKRFLEFASPQAQRLIMLLAAAPVITPPVVRLIRDSMLYNSQSPLPIAEVFLSGLIQRLSGQDIEDKEIQVHTQDLVQYDFEPKTRQVLLEKLPAVDTLDVVNSVSAAVEKRWNQHLDQDFRAFLFNPDMQEPEGFENLRSFASVTAEILEPLGGQYAELAQQLRQGTPQQQTITPDDEFEIPELRDIEIVVAKLVDAEDEVDAEPEITLVIDEYYVATIVVESDDSDFERFEFVMATIVYRQALANQSQGISSQDLIAGSEWVIQRQTRSAYRFVEILSNVSGSLELEMVSIPGGMFTMGSPSTEPERFDREGPQHEVTVAPFFMGRYPVTQAQWRLVAGLEQINRKLESDPSRFKGNYRPVEKVSWYEAVEFCERLSRHTGNAYRLPTEAEWEYACRAETITPFHFGETISSELANYRGTSIYNNGPQGEYRDETTPVDHFGIANAFGLSDMHGNVFEWCRDHWHGDYTDVPADGSAWLTNDGSASRVRRGGSWYDAPRICRSAYRVNLYPDDRSYIIGFRVVLSAPRTLQA